MPTRVALPHLGQTSMTLSARMGISLWMMPPCLALLPGLGVASCNIDAFDNDLVLCRHGNQDLTLLALVLAAQHDYGIVSS